MSARRAMRSALRSCAAELRTAEFLAATASLGGRHRGRRDRAALAGRLAAFRGRPALRGRHAGFLGLGLRDLLCVLGTGVVGRGVVFLAAQQLHACQVTSVAPRLTCTCGIHAILCSNERSARTDRPGFVRRQSHCGAGRGGHCRRAGDAPAPATRWPWRRSRTAARASLACWPAGSVASTPLRVSGPLTAEVIRGLGARPCPARDRLYRMCAGVRAGAVGWATDRADGVGSTQQRSWTAHRRGPGRPSRPDRRRFRRQQLHRRRPRHGRRARRAGGAPASCWAASSSSPPPTSSTHCSGRWEPRRCSARRRAPIPTTVLLLEQRLTDWAADLDAAAGQDSQRRTRRGSRRRYRRGAAGTGRPA